MGKHLTPLEVLERVFGPYDALSGIARLHHKAFFLWRRPSKGRDPGDIPSARHQRAFLTEARRRKLRLRPEWLIEGAPADEVEAALAPGSVVEAAE